MSDSSSFRLGDGDVESQVLNLRIREKKPKEGEEEEPKVSPKFVYKDCVSLGIYRKEETNGLIMG